MRKLTRTFHPHSIHPHSLNLYFFHTARSPITACLFLTRTFTFTYHPLFSPARFLTSYICSLLHPHFFHPHFPPAKLRPHLPIIFLSRTYTDHTHIYTCIYTHIYPYLHPRFLHLHDPPTCKLHTLFFNPLSFHPQASPAPYFLPALSTYIFLPPALLTLHLHFLHIYFLYSFRTPAVSIYTFIPTSFTRI